MIDESLKTETTVQAEEFRLRFALRELLLKTKELAAKESVPTIQLTNSVVDKACLQISSKGKWVARKDKDRIFDLDYYLWEERGLGVSLYLAKQFIKEQNTLSKTSEWNLVEDGKKGWLQFSVTMPLVGDNQERPNDTSGVTRL